MTTKRKPIEPWQMEDAQRLLNLFKSKIKISQQQFGHDFGIGSQGAVWQYLHGRTPLNITALIRFSKGIEVEPAEISPRLAELLAMVKPGELREPFTLYAADGNTQSVVLDLFSKLTRSQQDDFILHLKAAVSANEAILRELAGTNLRGVHDDRSSKHLPPAPK